MKEISTLENRKLVIRADASNAIGTGHIMRCLSIGQTWKDYGGDVYYIVNELPLSLENRLIKENINVLKIPTTTLGSISDAEETIRKFKEVNGEVLIIDGYNFLGSYQEKIMNSGIKSIVIDDHHYSDFYCTNVILNKGLNAKNIKYKINTEAKLLLGPDYTTLRREFLKYNRIRNIPEKAKEILITFGGSDPKDITSRALKSLVEITEDINLTIVVGSAYKYQDKLNEYASKLNGNYQVLSNVDNMASLMERSDLAITAGGTTLYELAFMGLPSITIKTVANQKSAKYFADLYNATVYLGDEEKLTTNDFLSGMNIISDKSLREKISRNCFNLVDGKGNNKVIKQIVNLMKD
nr:UDP-2,4-diacetamido-2,4,6-trideoxy-beta-L-altropyranose hydrolase [Oceanobacillus alkalisoli]